MNKKAKIISAAAAGIAAIGLAIGAVVLNHEDDSVPTVSSIVETTEPPATEPPTLPRYEYVPSESGMTERAKMLLKKNKDIYGWIKIDNTQETVTGTPLNDKLTKFRQQFTRLMNESSDLVHQHDQAIMNGRNMEEVNTRLAAKDADINRKMDKLVTTFVTDNMDNILGPYVFITICMNKYNVPMLDAWVEDIMTRATDKFKNNPQVKEYYEAAQENQNIMNGTKVPDNQSQPQQTSPAPPQDGQTPNEMAQ